MSRTETDRELGEALAGGERRLERVAGELEELARTHGEQVHARLRSLLTQLPFAPAQARPTSTGAYKDAVTGLYNYHYFQEQLEREIRRADSSGAPLSLVMLGIIDFEDYRERSGHQASREALVALARLLGPVLRDKDVPIRFGPEELVLLLPGTAKGLAGRLADVVRQRVEGHEFPGGPLAVSLGVATYPGDAANGHELVSRADRAHYLARVAGKNQVQMFGDNLRSHRRVEARLSGEFSLLETNTHKLATINISQAGMLFLSEHPVAEGAFLQIRLRLPGQEYPLDLLSQVVRVGERRGDQHEIAVRFFEVSARDRERLAAWLRRREAEGAG